MHYTAKDDHAAAKSTSVELQELGDGNGDMARPHILRYSEEERKGDRDDYAHMARLGKQPQFDVRVTQQPYLRIS
jgi:hypothetical protein